MLIFAGFCFRTFVGRNGRLCLWFADDGNRRWLGRSSSGSVLISKWCGRCQGNTPKLRWAILQDMSLDSGDGRFGPQPHVDFRCKRTQAKIASKTVGVAIATFWPCTRGLNDAGHFAIRSRLSKATNMSVPVERGRKREVTRVVRNDTSLFETNRWSIPTFAGARQRVSRSKHSPTTPP